MEVTAVGVGVRDSLHVPAHLACLQSTHRPRPHTFPLPPEARHPGCQPDPPARPHRDVAAVASRRAGELYGLSVLEDGIQDQCDNVTRFIVLSRDPQVAAQPNDTRPYKTSIVFTLHAGPGMLFKALSVFALRDIDLTKIESRPMRENPLVLSMDYDDSSMRTFNYMFYIDFVGSLAEPKVQNALRHMEEISPFLRILGSYPRDVDL
ncbi:ADT1 [Auxenochlorella protothecoides x Auxenochlorella symbiontica]